MKKINNFIQEMQLKVNDQYDTIVEWIPYNQLINIKEIGKNDDFATMYSATWSGGSLHYDIINKKWLQK